MSETEKAETRVCEQVYLLRYDIDTLGKIGYCSCKPKSSIGDKPIGLGANTVCKFCMLFLFNKKLRWQCKKERKNIVTSQLVDKTLPSIEVVEV